MECFKYNKKNDKKCKKNTCQYWIKHKESNNCIVIASQKENYWTLERIGDLIGVTRMRVCQIEKKAINKIKQKLSTLTNA